MQYPNSAIYSRLAHRFSFGSSKGSCGKEKAWAPVSMYDFAAIKVVLLHSFSTHDSARETLFVHTINNTQGQREKFLRCHALSK
jgi:hypothetical protein